jgi:hypothetical protein
MKSSMRPPRVARAGRAAGGTGVKNGCAKRSGSEGGEKAGRLDRAGMEGSGSESRALPTDEGNRDDSAAPTLAKKMPRDDLQFAH